MRFGRQLYEGLSSYRAAVLPRSSWWVGLEPSAFYARALQEFQSRLSLQPLAGGDVMHAEWGWMVGRRQRNRDSLVDGAEDNNGDDGDDPVPSVRDAPSPGVMPWRPGMVQVRPMRMVRHHRRLRAHAARPSL